jgi:hypothetical protein
LSGLTQALLEIRYCQLHGPSLLDRIFHFGQLLQRVFAIVAVSLEGPQRDPDPIALLGAVVPKNQLALLYFGA